MADRPNPALVVMDPAGAAGDVARELTARYGGAYAIGVHPTAAATRAALGELADRAHDVALVLADRAAGGVALLEEARALHPRARRGLLLGWAESRSHREEIAAAFARRSAEFVVARPTGGHDERFHRGVTELLDEWWRVHGEPAAAVRIVDVERSARVHEMCDALQRHDIPYVLHLAGSAEAAPILDAAGTDVRFPVVALRDGRTLVDPTNRQLADALGARTEPGAGVYDVVVVGGGPAGLSAAVYAASEGLRTALVEPTAMGGQAGTSSMIRNYLGFPRGISGAELATRAFEQAILFGVEMVYGRAAAALHDRGDVRVVELADGTEIPSRSVVVATGVAYRTLDVPSLAPFAGVGVFHGAAMSEAPVLAGEDVVVVGGGNSAGQAALHLARFARRVTLLVRGRSLADSMSDYLVTEIAATAGVDVRFGAEVVGGGGGARLEHVEVRDVAGGPVTSLPAAGLFVLIGAAPHTGWLPAAIERDGWGYVATGPTPADPVRSPYATTMAGVFAVGDVRDGSIKRVASAAGEGAACVRHLHEFLRAPAPAVTAG